MERKKYVAAKYLRVSSEDGDKAESDSIANQRKLIDESLGDYFGGMDVEVAEFADDGYTGTNMNRPGLQRLLKSAKAGEVNCIVVKDFSRFSRDYVDFGTYIEKFFPKWGTRFISVNDGYDSNALLGTAGGMDVALKGIVNAMYSRDLSEKTKSAVRALNKNGKFTGGRCLYGYTRSCEDKRRLVIDPIAAEIVKRIFQMRADGMTYAHIADALNREGILPPSAMRESDKGEERLRCKWSGDVVRRILKNEQYTGTLVSGKSERVAVGSSKKRLTAREKHITAENALEATVSRELFEAVQPEAAPKRRTQSRAGVFRGKLRCGSCGHVLTAYKLGEDDLKYYCRYKYFGGDGECAREAIRENELREAVSRILENEMSVAVGRNAVNEIIGDRVRKIEYSARLADKKVRAEKENRSDAYIRLAAGEISQAEFLKVRAEIEDRVAESVREAEELQVKAELARGVSAEKMMRRYAESGEMLRGLIKEIRVYSGGRLELVWDFKDKFCSPA